MLEAETNAGTACPPVVGDRPEARAGDTIFGSFWIDKSEIAIPVTAVREVVNQPAETCPVALAPPYVTGLFNLRGIIVPIIDLRRLLNFPEFEDSTAPLDQRKVAIIEHGDRCAGILFDRAGEVINDAASARVNFQSTEGAGTNAIIGGVLQLEGGDRLVQILDAAEMLRNDRIPQPENVDPRKATQKDRGERRSCITFEVGHTSCALDLRHVQEVRDMLPVEHSPLSHGCVIGTARLRGSLIPVFDFLCFLSKGRTATLDHQALAGRKLLIVRTEGGPIGLVVYRIQSILPFFEGDVLPFSRLALPRDDLVTGCLQVTEDSLVILLDHTRLLADSDLLPAARACSNLRTDRAETAKNAAHLARPQHEQQEVEKNEKKTLERRTFILFSMAMVFAMDTRHVKEVINRPKSLLAPPYRHDFVEGILNLRGELITLINLRKLYGVPPCEDTTQKVLIFNSKSQKFGVLVDAVHEIAMTTSDKVLEDKPTDYGDDMCRAAEDVRSVVQVERSGKRNTMVMILDVDALIERCAKVLDSPVPQALQLDAGLTPERV